jgi:WD40 repeat protein
MDLMGDIGAADQLISAREENKLIKAKVKEQIEMIKDLRLTNAQLQAEVDMYRKDAALPSFTNLALGAKNIDTDTDADMDHDQTTPVHDFVSSGDGTYPTDPAVTLPNAHGISNPLCCALDRSDALIGTGGADSYVSIMSWGSALAPEDDASINTVQRAARVHCTAPVICISFSTEQDIVAAGCMDGSVHLIGYKLVFGKVKAWALNIVSGDKIKCTKYVKSLAFAPKSGLLASASADGTVQITRITLLVDNDNDDDDDDDDMEGGAESLFMNASVEMVNSLHLAGAVETVCFVNGGDILCLYERETSYLSYFDLKNNFKMTKHSVNGCKFKLSCCRFIMHWLLYLSVPILTFSTIPLLLFTLVSAVTGGFDSHVSFAIMDLALSPDGKYLCAATDNSRNIIIEVGTSNIIRDLYGHKNDGFSQPRVAWSSSGKYIYGNTQEDNSMCVWDIASTKIVKILKAHKGQLRDIFSSNKTDTVVTSSYDKTIKVWLNEM